MTESPVVFARGLPAGLSMDELQRRTAHPSYRPYWERLPRRWCKVAAWDAETDRMLDIGSCTGHRRLRRLAGGSTEFREDALQALQPVALAGGADFGEVRVGIVPEQLENVGFGSEPTRVEFQRDQLRQGDQLQAAARSHNKSGGANGILDRRRETPGETDDLQQPESAGDVNDATQRVGGFGFAQFRRKAGLPERCHNVTQGRNVRIDAKIHITCLPDVMVCSKRDRADNNGIDPVAFEDRGNLLGHGQYGLWSFHGSRILRGGVNP